MPKMTTILISNPKIFAVFECHTNATINIYLISLHDLEHSHLGLDDVLRKGLIHAYGREEALLLLVAQTKLQKYKSVIIYYIVIYTLYSNILYNILYVNQYILIII